MGRSRLYLPKLENPPQTLLEHFISVFPKVSARVWKDRFDRGVITTQKGESLPASSPYSQGTTIYYMREVALEPPSLEEEIIIYRDSSIVVADKPHGMPVTPAGDYVERSLVFRLQKITGAELAPAHRLDRETAGLVLFTVNTSERGHYQQLFSNSLVEREYLALGHVAETPTQTRWHIENRIAPGEPWFRQQIVEGEPNAITDIELLETRDNVGLFRLKPKTGKKHQLRVHMASIGLPIVGDPYYPELREKRADEPPLQLLACRLSFEGKTFESARTLR